MSRFTNKLGYVLVIVVLGGFFTWVLLQMAGHIQGGRGMVRLDKMVIGFAIMIAALAIGLGFSMLLSRVARRRKQD